MAASVAFVIAACTSSGDGSTAFARSERGWFQARPLIMPGQHTTTVRADPFGSVQVPDTEGAYSRLSRAKQAALADALRGVDCAHPPQLSDSTVRVVCDADSDAFLLGAPLLTGNDVVRANAIAPTPSTQGWEVSFSLTPAAANELYLWTSRHHSLVQSGVFNDVQTTSKPPCGLFRPVPCAAFTAYVSDDLVATVQVWFAAAGYSVTIQGAFHRGFATRLTRRLNG